jgi:hypothetical protein
MINRGTRVTTAPTAIFLANTLKSAIRIEQFVYRKPELSDRQLCRRPISIAVKTGLTLVGSVLYAGESFS